MWKRGRGYNWDCSPQSTSICGIWRGTIWGACLGNTLHKSLSHSHFVLSLMFDDNSFAFRTSSTDTGQGDPTGIWQKMFWFWTIESAGKERPLRMTEARFMTSWRSSEEGLVVGWIVIQELPVTVSFLKHGTQELEIKFVFVPIPSESTIPDDNFANWKRNQTRGICLPL